MQLSQQTFIWLNSIFSYDIINKYFTSSFFSDIYVHFFTELSPVMELLLFHDRLQYSLIYEICEIFDIVIIFLNRILYFMCQPEISGTD